jgi:hypothetical protein
MKLRMHAIWIVRAFIAAFMLGVTATSYAAGGDGNPEDVYAAVHEYSQQIAKLIAEAGPRSSGLLFTSTHFLR